jgi:5'(3')-deoxyribonucleotidase
VADAPRVAGVDVDGVRGDQVTPLLPLIEERTGIRLTFDDIIEWNIPIGESDFKTEMAAAMDPRFVEEMPLHEGASEMMDRLNDDWTILVITTRAPHLVEATERWLERHSLPFDKVISAAGNEKAFHGTDVLIDDYTENVKHFLTASDV